MLVGLKSQRCGSPPVLITEDGSRAVDVGAVPAQSPCAAGAGRPTGLPSAYLTLDLDMSDSAKVPTSPAAQSILEARA